MWMTESPCAGRPKFLDGGERSVRVCVSECKVRKECADLALAQDELEGCWAGIVFTGGPASPEQRNLLASLGGQNPEPINVHAERVHEALRLFRGGMPSGDIARRFGTSPRTIQRWLRSVAPDEAVDRRVKYDKDKLTAYAALVKAGEITIAEAWRKAGCSQARMHSMVHGRSA